MAVKNVKVLGKMNSGWKIEVEASNHKFIIDQPKAAGGTDEGPNPLEVFLSSLVGCVGSISKIVAIQRKIDLKGLEVLVEGALNPDFLTGKTKEGRAGFEQINVEVKIDADMTLEEKKEFIAEVDRRCPISDNIAHESNVSFVSI